MPDQNEPVVPENVQPVAPVAPVTEPEPNKGAPVSQTDPNISKIISQRDKNFNDKKTLEEEVELLRSENEETRLRLDKKEYLDTLCAKYPTVDRELLEEAVSPAQAELIAEKFVAVKETAKQEALAELQNVEPTPRYSPETKAELLEAKKDSGDLAGAIGIMLN